MGLNGIKTHSGPPKKISWFLKPYNSRDDLLAGLAHLAGRRAGGWLAILEGEASKMSVGKRIPTM